MDSAVNTRSMRGPVDVNNSRSQAVLRPLAFDGVELEASGYLGSWQELNRTATLPHCMTSLEGNGSLDNVRRLVGHSSAAYRGMVFQDSDIYKTLEAVAWVLGQQEMPELREFLDSTAALLEEAQDEDGYLNSWFQGVHPEQRWQDLRWGHEMTARDTWCRPRWRLPAPQATRGFSTLPAALPIFWYGASATSSWHSSIHLEGALVALMPMLRCASVECVPVKAGDICIWMTNRNSACGSMNLRINHGHDARSRECCGG